MSIEFLNPKSWPKPKGYSNGILATGTMIFVAGQIGWNKKGKIVSDDFVKQVEQALKNVVAVLREGGAKPENIVRLTWYVTDKHEYLAALKGVGEVYKHIFGRHYPAMTLVQVADLVEDGAKVEIEATAVV